MDERRAAFLAQLFRHGIAVLAARPVVKHDFGPQRAGVGEFHRRGIDRHDDCRREPQPPRRPGHALRMVAAGDANHAAQPFIVR